MLNLPEPIALACQPLFEALPFALAMEKLTGEYPKHTALVAAILQDPALAGRSDLAAGLWLYVDDLERSHTVSQGIHDATGSYWHSIMHRREGDFSNSHYWMRQALDHPLLQGKHYPDPDSLIDAVAAAQGRDDAALVERQKEEWKTLFEWCAARSSP